MRELYSYNNLCNSSLDLSPAARDSSESSSPRSSSTEDDLLEIHRGSADQNHCNTSKPIYNFSIPDFIKHERQPVVSSAADDSVADSPVIVSECSSRSRNAKRRFDSRESADHEASNTINVTQNTNNCRRHKRRKILPRNVTQSPQLIDLTGPDQEDNSSTGVIDEINHNPYLDSTLTGVAETPRELESNHSTHGEVTFASVAEDLQNFRRRLRESRERINQIREQVTSARQERIRYHMSHRSSQSDQTNIVSDGLAYTSSNDANSVSQHPIERIDAFNLQDSASALVIDVDDDTTELRTPDFDREVAVRMLESPLYSPPFLTPRNVQRSAPTTHRMSNIEQSFREHMHMLDPMQENRQSEDEVEFLRELRPPHASSGRSTRVIDLDASNETNYNWGHLSRARRRFSGLFSNPNINVPDFLFPYVHLFNPAAAPRLRHFPSNNNDEGEDYEALWNLAERLGPAKPRGLSKSEIDRIHAFRFSASCAEETNSTCVVCMSEYCFREKIRKLPCTHDFHSKCIDKWLKSNKTCPVCRDEIKCM